MANLYSPATHITAVKQEPPQSPPPLPPTEPIMQQISFAALVAAIKQELLQQPHSLPSPTIILRPSLAPSTSIMPPSLQPQIPIPTTSQLYPNLVPPPSLQPPPPSQLRPNLVPPPLAVVKTEPDQPQLLQPPPSLPPPPIIFRPFLAPSTPVLPPSQPPTTPIPTPSLFYPNFVPTPSLQPPKPIPTPSQPPPNLVQPPLSVVKTEPDQPPPPPPPPQEQPQPPPPPPPPPIILRPSLPPSTPILPPSLPPPTPIPPPSQLRPNLVAPPLAVIKTVPDQPQPQQQQKPQFLKSINDLASLSKSLNAFNSKFEDLTNHIVSINQAIDSKFNEPPPAHTNTTSSTTPTPQQPKTNSSPRPPRGSIQRFCQRMRAKAARKYIISNLQDVSKLREEIPEALKLSPEPAKLVLDCVGQYFVGSQTCTSNPCTMTTRKALVLLLEIFGTFHGRNRVIVSVEVKLKAEKVAIGWRNRLIKEGGIDKASEIDARALLLFVGCFGIPSVFSNVELGNLFNSSNPKGISDSLKASPLLPCRIPDIIDTMVKTGMHFKALEVASIFGLEDKLSPRTIMTSLLPESTKAFEQAQQKANITPIALKKATENHLVVLRLTVWRLDRGGYGTMLLGSWKTKEKIVKLEEEIAELDKRIAEKKKKTQKRKPDQMGSSSRVKSREVKRLRSETEGSHLPKSNVDQSCEQSTAAVLAEGDGLIPDSLNANSNYPAVSAAPHGSFGISRMAGTTGVGSSGIGVIPASSCCLEEGEIEVDEIGQTMSVDGLPYKWQQGCVPKSTTMWFASLFGSSPSVEGFVGVLDSTVRTPADRYRFADSLV